MPLTQADLLTATGPVADGLRAILASPSKPTVPEVLPLLNAFYALPDNGMGGAVHIVTEDGNVEDHSVWWCASWAEERSDAVGCLMALVLARCSRTQRVRLHREHGYPG